MINSHISDMNRLCIELKGPRDAIHPRIAAVLTRPPNDATRAPAPAAESMPEVLVHRHADFALPINGPLDFARALNYAPARIAKSLLVRRAGGGAEALRFALACVPATERVNFKAVARALGWTRCSVADPRELERLIGYDPGGVSPLGCGDLPVLIDEALLSHPTILVGGGRAGVEIEVAPRLLVRLCGAAGASITGSDGIEAVS